MSGLNETPSANRVHIAFFGLRNAGKSTLVNAFTGQAVAIVSATPGTTTDPVSKAMEILPLGPCLVTDTAGLDDVGELGAQRVEKTLKVLETTDIAVWVSGDDDERGIADAESWKGRFVDACQARKVTVLEYRRGESVEELKRKIAEVRLAEAMPGLLDGLVRTGDRVVCVCPIDGSAPKGRLILPQVQVIRECLDLHAICTVCQPEELTGAVEGLNARNGRTGGRLLVITDSQAFRAVDETLNTFREPSSGTRTMRLTSFSILFARQKGDIAAYMEGLRHLAELEDGDRVLVAEGCTHHRQCNDIGTVKIPKALERLTGRKLDFTFVSGTGFEDPVVRMSDYSIIVQCGGCMLTRREMLRRLAVAKAAGVPVVNYGMVLAKAAGVEVGKCAM